MAVRQQISRAASESALLQFPVALAADPDPACAAAGLRPAASLDAQDLVALAQREAAPARSPRARRPPRLYEDVRARRPAPAHPAAVVLKKPSGEVEATAGSAAGCAGANAPVPDCGADAGQEQGLQRDAGCPAEESEPARSGDFAVEHCVLSAVACTAGGSGACQAPSGAKNDAAVEHPATEQAATGQTVAGDDRARQPGAEDRSDKRPAAAPGVAMKRKRDAEDSLAAASAHAPVRFPRTQCPVSGRMFMSAYSLHRK